MITHRGAYYTTDIIHHPSVKITTRSSIFHVDERWENSSANLSQVILLTDVFIVELHVFQFEDTMHSKNIKCNVHYQHANIHRNDLVYLGVKHNIKHYC